MTAQPSPGQFIDEAPGVVASVERIDAWLAVAKKGDRFVYATREHLSPRSTGAMRMRTLAARDYVCLIQPRRAPGESLFNFTAIRTDVALPWAKPSDRSVLAAVATPLVDGEAAIVDALLPVLERAAQFGRPCPTDQQLAARAAMPVAAVQPALAAMSAALLIRIEAAPSPTRRRIIIVATGDRTGLITK